MRSYYLSIFSFLLPLVKTQYGSMYNPNMYGSALPYQQTQSQYSPYVAQQPAISARTELDCNYDQTSGPFCKRSKLSPFMCKYNDNYPRDTANYIDENYGPAYKGLSVTEIDVWDVYDGPIGEDKDSICETDIELVRPGYLKNVKDQWRAAVQTAETAQTIRVERCLRPGSACRHVPGCYETTCKQRYSFVRLLVFDPCKKLTGPSYEIFRVPTACDCQMTPLKKGAGASGGFGPGIPDFISNSPEIVNQMKNIEPGGFSNIPSSSTNNVNGKR